MNSQPYKHVAVPGFGCTYPKSFFSSSERAEISLQQVTLNSRQNIHFKFPTLIFVLEAGIGELKSANQTFQIDFKALIAVPENTQWTIETHSPLLKYVAIQFQKLAFTMTSECFEIDFLELKKCFLTGKSFPRTTWVNELCHRYTFERSVAQMTHSLAASFLETELLKEFYYLTTNKLDSSRPAFFEVFPESIQKALLFLEQNLHQSISINQLAKAAQVSPATLTRLFQKHLHSPPMKYLWNRRLDEGDKLLQTSVYGVSEVAALLGFSDPSVFSNAYLKRFGRRPSRYAAPERAQP